MLPACGVGECGSKFYITDNFGQISRNKTSRTGWTVGGGAEWQFLPHWSVFLEYDYLASNETRALPVVLVFGETMSSRPRPIFRLFCWA